MNEKAISADLDLARRILSDEPGTLQRSPHANESFVYVEPVDAEVTGRGGRWGVRLVFYAHRTTARNYHTRVYDGGSLRTERARELMQRLDQESGLNCTFTRKKR